MVEVMVDVVIVDVVIVDVVMVSFSFQYSRCDGRSGSRSDSRGDSRRVDKGWKRVAK